MRDFDADPLRIAMLGMIPGNCHPYSWSAIINGYDREKMSACPAPAIPRYLNRQPGGSVRLPLGKVTHIWTDDPADARLVAEAALIPHVVSHPEAVIGLVDAVIVSTDDGDDHVRRVSPFVSAGLPVFVDKPLATNIADLAQFAAWRRQGGVILSSSGLRYAPEVAPLRGRPWRWFTGSTCKSWERYGIHVLEPLATVTGPGFTRIRARAMEGGFAAEVDHRSGVGLSLRVIEEGYGSAFVLHGYGDARHEVVEMRDNYTAFRAQLLGFLDVVAGRAPEPVDFAETLELMAVLIAARESAARDGAPVDVASVLARAGIPS